MTDKTQKIKKQEGAEEPLFSAKNKKIKAKTIPLEKARQFEVDKEIGLTAEQLEIRAKEGLLNADKSKKGKTVFQIILSNLFTYFNLIYLVVTAVLVYFKEYKQLTFLAVVVANTGIALIQELRSKRALDKLKLISAPQVEVLRQGVLQKISVKEVALSDIVRFTLGNQICADSVIEEGFVEVNEALLTGESDSLVKRSGDKLFAGSFVVSGSCTATVSAVGKYNYVNSLSSRARRYKRPKSQLNGSFKIILYVISVAIPVLGVLLFLSNSFALDITVGNSILEKSLSMLVNKTASPIVNIIPAGPFLLTSMALAVSVLRLSKSKTMVQELYCIEMLARVDCLCLDKTGTLTDGTMKVVESMDLRAESDIMVKDIVSTLLGVLKGENMTDKSLLTFFGDKKHARLREKTVVPFSSQRKFAAVSFEGQGTYFMGAPEYVLPGKNQRVQTLVQNYSAEGYRVLLLAHSSGQIMTDKEGYQFPALRRPVALIVIEDHIRQDAQETLKWFSDLGVDIKIISGDNPVTVSNIAMRLNIKDAQKAISLEGLSDEDVKAAAKEYAVFGRVSPDQKCVLVQALKGQGKTVAMTGDGVNDILALREADCSIALAGGSDAARNVSHLVLLEDNFSSLPKVVAEGRRVVNNIQNASSMFFMKTIFALGLIAFVVILNLGYGIKYLYPFETTQLLLLDTVVVGIPTTFLALQRNENIIKGHFLANVLKKALPAAIIFAVSFGALYGFFRFGALPADMEKHHTIAAICYVLCGFYALIMACRPFNVWKIILLCLTISVIVAGCLFTGDFLSYVPLQREEVLLLLTVALGCLPLYALIYEGFNRVKPVKAVKSKK